MSILKDITGQKFNRLLVVSRAENSPNGKAIWFCKCDCGNTLKVCGCNLRNGHTQSCGCLQSERTAEASTIHGKAHTKIHSVWKAMKRRCTDPKNQDYHSYGGRGITVCQEWQDSFQAFHDHVSRLPHFGEKGYSLDRKNNNGNYEPGNVRWATAKEQANNSRRWQRKWEKQT